MHQKERRIEAAIMAGLRLLQGVGEGVIRVEGDREKAIDDIATSGGDFEVLTTSEIDDLCESINLDGIAVGGGTSA